jgi:hypothetical protein
MGRSCSTYDRLEKCIQNFSRKLLKGGDHFEHLDVNTRIIFNFTLKDDNIKLDLEGIEHVFATKIIWHRIGYNDGLL